MNKKGFTLIELIIVIAIMAILVGVLAPNLLRYIEKTNVSADLQTADTIRTVFIAALLDPELAAYSSQFTFCGIYENQVYYASDNSLVDASSNDTPLGTAIAAGLGYTTFTDMVAPDGGILSEEFRQKRQFLVMEIAPKAHTGEIVLRLIVVQKDGSWTQTYIPEHGAP